jgi:Lysyl oxidase/Secretion system C-terminal sorting domain
MIRIYILPALLLAFFCTTLHAQNCLPTQSAIRLEIDPDYYFYEVSWEIVNAQTNQILAAGAPMNADPAEFNYCVESGTCLIFRMKDSYGDGIAPDGSYRIYVNNVLLRESIGENYGSLQTTAFNCPPGHSCDDQNIIQTGTHTTIAGLNSTWHSFTPAQSGMYEVSTCFNTNLCPTRIWVYDACGGTVSPTNLGTIYYSTNGCGGAGLAKLSMALVANVTYYIRVGYASGICNNQPVSFTLEYQGPITGCTDPTACNYNPLATVSDTCIYFGQPGCTEGPDLVVLQDVLLNSITQGFMSNADGCAVNEGCLRGFGPRDLIEFTTHIQNIGELDYYIGQTPSSPNTPSDQFVFDACHGHWHYVGYAEYVLYDAQGNLIPIGSKTGFCVLDLECSGGGSSQYGCTNMGISAGCGDIYSSGLPCQWIDITDLPPGTYTFVVRVNWDKTPDKNGRIEKTYDNNWAQACFNLSYLPNGQAEVDFINDCPSYVDCEGVTFGDAQADCEGTCNGSALRGDWNRDTLRTDADVLAYMTSALTDTSSVTTCRELYTDGHLDVYDAAILNECVLHADEPAYWVNEFPCQFPSGIFNPDDIVYFLPGAVDTTARTFDIEIVNPYNKILGYEFDLAGLVIDSVVNLATGFTPELLHNDHRIIALSPDNAMIEKNILPTPILRVYYSEAIEPGSSICIDSVIAAVNERYQRSAALIPDDNCIIPVISSTSDPRANSLRAMALPNPSAGDITLFFENESALPTNIELLNMQGQPVQVFNKVRDNSVRFMRNNLPNGVYQYTVRNERGIATGRIVWQ